MSLFSLGSVVVMLMMAWTSPTFAKPKAKKSKPVADNSRLEDEKLEEAEVKMKEGVELVEKGKYEEAIALFEEVYELVPDPIILVRIGDAYQRDGTENSDTKKIEKAVVAYEAFVDQVPEGEESDAIRARIDGLTDYLAAEEVAKEEEKKARERERLAAEQAQLAAEKKQKSMQIVLAAGLLAGADLDSSGVFRMSGGALLAWERFALEGKIGIDGFLRTDSEQGVAGRSFPVLDIGARYGMKYRFLGPFVSAGATFGLFAGNPRDRALKNDVATCGVMEDGIRVAGNCNFDLDKAVTGRLGFGYGFAGAKTTTVAPKIEFVAWLYSVDSANPSRLLSVEKPQTGFSILIGLEFMRWI